MKQGYGIKAQDIVVLLKLASAPSKKLNQLELARQLHISQSEISAGLKRATESGLLISGNNRVAKKSFIEFLIYGLPFVFPARPGPIERGMATSHSAAPLNKLIRSDIEDQYVWPNIDGKIKGHSIIPIYPSAPMAAKEDIKLYELLSIVDALRVGRIRERKIARDELEKRLNNEQ